MNIRMGKIARIRWLSIALCLVAGVASTVDAEPDEVLLLSFFRGNGQAGIFLAKSEDGLTFTPLNHDLPVMKPAPWEGQNLTRDPSIVFHDGIYRAVWTTSWKGACFGYAESKDLVAWSDPVRVEPFKGKRNPRNTWAPEICRDPYQKNFMIFWSSVLDPKLGQQTFVTRTADGINFLEAELLLDRDYSCIDAMLLLDAPAKRWIMIYKNEETEEKGGKNLRVATAPFDFSTPWLDDGEKPIVGPGTGVGGDTMAEGPSLLKMYTGWCLYWDSPLREKAPSKNGAEEERESFGLATSSDLKNWKNRTDELHLPRNVRHGTVFRVPRSAVGWLKP